MLTLLSVSPVYALNTGAKANIDAMQDNEITERKYKTDEILETQFRAMDTNRDGRVSKDEFVKFKMQEYQKKQAQVFDSLDMNHDGSLTKVEFQRFRR